jgi:hypothetical protein
LIKINLSPPKEIFVEAILKCIGVAAIFLLTTVVIGTGNSIPTEGYSIPYDEIY